MKLLSAIPVFLLGSLLVAAMNTPEDEVQVGSKAPELKVSDPSGKVVTWNDIDRKTTILYFHAGRTRNGGKAIDLLVKELRKFPKLCRDTAVVIVVDELAEGEELPKSIRETGCQVRIALAPDESPQETFGVIAFPSVFVLDAEKSVTGIVKGYGTLFGFEVVAAARFAAGLIDEEAYAELLSGSRSTARETAPRESRMLRLARELMREGDFAAARVALERLIESEPNPGTARLLLVHVLLKQGDLEAAESWILRLQDEPGRDPDAAVLAARVACLRGDTEAVEAILATLDPHSANARYVKGLLHERRGEWKPAAHAFREALEIRQFE